MQWDLKTTKLPITINEVVDILLDNRGISSEHEYNFFHPRHPRDISAEEVGIDPGQLAKAVQRIQQAKKNKEYVIVFGDYDADGVTATTILWETLYELGVKAMPFIPHREKHGYGISDRSLDDLIKERKPDLIITVDNGIVAHGAFERLKREGVDAIITDHHMPEQRPLSLGERKSGEHQIGEGEMVFPYAHAVIHSTKLCGATTAWFLARALSPTKAYAMLDLCAIGTIADQMILKDANRSFAFHGLEALRKTQRIGLLNLYKIADVKPADITTQTVNYAIAPRINAMGRLGHALDALRALCTKDQQKSLELMQSLQTTNEERQELTWTVIEQVMKRKTEWEHEHVIVISSEAYHEGVIGLIAGKLMEEFAKPAIVLSIGEKYAKGSARSVGGVNIVDLIRQVRDELIDVGGHPMAAGFSVDHEKLESVTKRLQELAKDQIDPSQLTHKIEVECEIPSQLISLDLIERIQEFAPFGNGNADPVFGLKNMKILEVYAMGKEKKHLKLSVQVNDSSNLKISRLDCIAFGKGNLEPLLLQTDVVDIAGMLSINEWNGRKKVQVLIKDVKATLSENPDDL